MTIALDQSLIFRVRRKAGANQLTPEQCIAINLLRRKGIRGTILAKAFRVSKNTIYYRCLTGSAASYRGSTTYNVADEVNRIIDKMGAEAAWRKFVTDDMVGKVNKAMETEVEART